MELPVLETTTEEVVKVVVMAVLEDATNFVSVSVVVAIAGCTYPKNVEQNSVAEAARRTARISDTEVALVKVEELDGIEPGDELMVLIAVLDKVEDVRVSLKITMLDVGLSKVEF